MELKTECGKLLKYRGYNEETIERFDKLAFHLTCIPLYERRELLTALMWQFTFRMAPSDFERFDRFWNEMNDSEK